MEGFLYQAPKLRLPTLVLHGTLAPRGSVVKVAGLGQEQLRFEGTARVFDGERKAMDDATVRSPITGIVSRRHVNAGDVVSPGGELPRRSLDGLMRSGTAHLAVSNVAGRVRVGDPTQGDRDVQHEPQ